MHSASEMAFVAKIPRDRLRNIIYGLGIAYPRVVSRMIETVKVIPEHDIPNDAHFNTPWLIYALNKYTKTAVTNALGIKYSKDFTAYLKKRGLSLLSKPRKINEMELREILIEHTPAEAANHFGVYPNYIFDLMSKYDIAPISIKLLKKCKAKAESSAKRENNKRSSISNFISGVKAAHQQPKS